MLEKDECQYVQIRALTDPGLREAIGGVCVHWALLELTVERVLSYLEGAKGLLRYESDLGNNLQRLLALAESSDKLDTTQKFEIRHLVEQVRCLRGERHRVTHGLWGKDDDGTLQSVFPALRRNVDPMKPMTTEDVRRVKLQIFFIGKALRAYVDPLDVVRIKWETD